MENHCQFNQYVTHRGARASHKYGGTPIEVKLHVQPNDFVDGRNSYVHFNILFSKGAISLANSVIETGSLANIFQRITLIARDGQTLDTLDNVNQYSAYTQVFTKPRSYRDSQGAVSGLDNLAIPKDFAFPFSIPLGDLINLFNYKDLLPHQLTDGMRIRFELAHALDVVMDATAADIQVEYTVSDFRVVLDTYTMDKSVAEELAKKPQVIDFETYTHKSQTFTAGAGALRAVMPAHFTCSKAIRAFAVGTRTPANILERIIFDYIGTGDDSADEEVRWRIGNRLVPATELTNADEQYYHTLKAFKGLGDYNSMGATIAQIEFNQTYKVHAVDLRRSFQDESQGTPSDNNNVIEFHWKKNTANEHQVNLFLVYVRRIVIDKGHLSILL